MDFDSTESAAQAPAGLVPWFDAPGRRTRGTLIAFGHWSTLGWISRPDILGLDTGCVWGGATERRALWRHAGRARALQGAMPAAQRPGE